MIKQVFDVYCDPSHGWLKVKKSFLERLGIADKITPYSYQRGEYAYLEEDCDATNFVGAYEEKFNISPKFRTHHSDKMSRIRNYDDYCVELN